MGTLTAEIEWVDAAKANQFLSNPGHNRPIRDKRVTYFCGIIERGEWQLTTDAVGISDEGELLNGQHRLLAIVKMDVECPLVILWGLDTKVFTVLDTGQKRTAAQTFDMLGFVNAATVAATARLVLQYESKTMGPSVYTNDQLVRLVTANDDAYRHWCSQGKSVSNSIGASAAAMSAFAILADRIHDAEDVEAFLWAIKTGANLQQGDPRLAARNWIVNRNTSHHASNRARQELGILIDGWNYWNDGVSRQHIKAWKFGDAFPRLQ